MFSHPPEGRRARHRHSRRRRLRPVVLELEVRWLLSAYVVNDAGDAPLDSVVGPGETATGTITLRSAIEQINIDKSGSISFAKAMTVSVGSQLDTITAAGVTINGGTLGSVTIHGGSGFSGLVIQGGSATIENLVVDDFSGSSFAGIVLKSGGNLIQDDYIGIDASGSVAAGNYDGILDDAGSNTIGNDVISGNTNAGIVISGGSHDLVHNNYVGTDATGLKGLGNPVGIAIQNASALNTIGGSVGGVGNIISANSTAGIDIDGTGTTQNFVSSNWIGTESNGVNGLSNGVGIAIFGGSTANTIGTTNSGAGNVISGNATAGISISDPGTSQNLVVGNFIGTNTSGAVALANADGIVDESGGNTIRGDVVSGNSSIGIFLEDATSDLVTGNMIGIDTTGSVAVGGQSAGGVVILDPSASNTIGGTTAAARNIISGNAGYGVETSGASSNVIEGNYIGTDATGSVAVGNQKGVVILLNSGSNTVGGTVAGARNVISGNTSDGVDVEGTGTQLNLVAGNFIGTDSTGKKALGNAGVGVYVYISATSNTIGGTSAAARNIIAASSISPYSGVEIYQAASNVVEGNYIGTDVTGSVALGNNAGVEIEGGAVSNIIGGTVAGAGNVISGNTSDGIDIDGSGTAGNLVAGNLIGTDATGKIALGNSNVGVFIFSGASGNIVGGTSAAARNIISASGSAGIVFDGTSGNLFEGNYVGTDITGSVALGNKAVAVGLQDASPSNTIGGTVAGARNLISGNLADGIDLSGAGTSSNLVAGNYIGTDATGKIALGNSHVNIDIFNSASANTIGGTAAAARNIVADNVKVGYAGIEVFAASKNVIEGNDIGTDVTGSNPLGNQIGVLVWSSSTSNTIGGTAAGAGNVIAFSKAGGVVVGTSTTDKSTGNAILGNSIFSNTKLGIDLGDNGVTANGASGHTGPNLFQDFPVLSSVLTTGGVTTITGTLAASASTTYRLEFFSNPASDPSGYGQGQTFLMFANVTTDASGNASFSVQTPTAVPGGLSLSATATDPNGNTSEFSADLVNATSTAASQLVVTTEPPSTVTAGSTFGLTITAETSSNTVATSFNGSVTIALLNNPGGSTLGGTLTVTAASGVATFSGLSLNKAGTGYTPSGTSGTLTAATTSAIAVNPAAATQLAVTIEPPASVTAGAGFGLAVSAEDQFGNVVPSFTSSVTVALDNNPSGTTLGGTLTVTAAKGVASFSGLTLDLVDTGYTLKATTSAFAAVQTGAFSVVPATASKLVITSQPPATTTAGSAFGLAVTLEDKFGNVATSYSGSVTVALSSNPDKSTLGGTLTATVTSGVATFSGLTLNKVGTGYTLSLKSGTLPVVTTSAITVTAAAATQLVPTTQPPASVTAGQPSRSRSPRKTRSEMSTRRSPAA